MDESVKYERLDAALIGEGLSVPLSVLPLVDSTNTEARRRILSGHTEPFFLLAEEQSAGRGRMGRSFYSPAGTGIYLSLAFAPRSEGGDPLLLTTAAAVAVLRAIQRVTGTVCGIKWVNDLYVRDRKVCGILAESLYLGPTRFVILGVGVNLCTEDFPEELRGIAGSLLPEGRGLRNDLAAALCGELCALTTDSMPEGFLDAYRAHSLVLGRDVIYWENGERFEGVAESVDERGRLLVRHGDGTERLLGGGEITLRLNNTESERNKA